MSEYPTTITEQEKAVKPGILILIAGATASGKNSVMQELLQQFPALQRVISYTTRQPRKDEADGKDYYFVTPQKFQEMRDQGEFLETVQYADYCYGTSKESLLPILNGQDMIRLVTMDNFRTYPDEYTQAYDEETAKVLSANTIPILVSAGLRNRLTRFESRGGDRREFRRRFNQEREILLGHPRSFPTIVYNRDGELSKAVAEVASLIQQRRQTH